MWNRISLLPAVKDGYLVAALVGSLDSSLVRNYLQCPTGLDKRASACAIRYKAK